MNTTRFLTFLAATTALLARADLLPPAQDSSSLKSKLTTVTGKAGTLPITAFRKGFVLFNIESLPDGVQPADITNARLRLYFPGVTKAGDIAVHTVQQAWKETGTAAEPTVSASPIETIPAAAVIGKQFFEVDVTATVQGWRANPATNFGFAFLASGHTSITIGAKEGSGSGYPCELELEIASTSIIADGTIGSAQLASDLTLGGTTMGSFSGSLLGNATTATTATNADSFTGTLAGDVTGTQGATVVSTVGGIGAASVAAGLGLVNAATPQSTTNTIVLRDDSAGFGAVNITLSGSLLLPATNDSNTGVIRQNGSSLLHTFGSNNLFVGAGAGNFTLTGGQNTALGLGALQADTTGRENTAIGYQALGSNTTGEFCTAVGSVALFSLIDGGRNNAAFGGNALYSTTTGSFNTALGLSTLYRNVIGEDNVAVGYTALLNSTGTGNIAIGRYAGGNLATGDYNIYVQNEGVDGESSTMRLGQAGLQATFIAGISGVTVSGGAAVSILPNGQLGTITSSRRFKDNIQPMGDSSDALLRLNPVTFTYKQELDPRHIPQWGLIAEEVAAVNPDWVVRDEKGEINTVRYEQINAMLLNEFLKERRRARDVETTLREENAALKKESEALKERLERIEARLGNR